MTQQQEIIIELHKRPNGMSDWEMMRLGISRPSARMSELKQMGYVFGKTLCRKINKYGREYTYFRYTLEGEPGGRLD